MKESSIKTSQRRIQSIEVGFSVLRALEAAEGPMQLRDIAAATGMPASKVHLYLVSFIREGAAYQDPATGHYGLGRFAIQLGLSAIRQLDIIELARDELVTVRQETGFACYLSLWGDRGPGIVSKVDGPGQGSLSVRLGYVLPLLTSATGQVFLAFLDEVETAQLCVQEIASAKEVQPHSELLPEASFTMEQVKELASSVRKSGYAMTANNINSDFAALSAPIFDYSGHIVAAITILGSQRLVTAPQKKISVQSLLGASGRLSERLGYLARNEEGPRR